MTADTQTQRAAELQNDLMAVCRDLGSLEARLMQIAAEVPHGRQLDLPGARPRTNPRVDATPFDPVATLKAELARNIDPRTSSRLVDGGVAHAMPAVDLRAKKRKG